MQIFDPQSLSPKPFIETYQNLGPQPNQQVPFHAKYRAQLLRVSAMWFGLWKFTRANRAPWVSCLPCRALSKWWFWSRRPHGEMYIVKWGMFGREIHGSLGMTGALIHMIICHVFTIVTACSLLFGKKNQPKTPGGFVCGFLSGPQSWSKGEWLLGIVQESNITCTLPSTFGAQAQPKMSTENNIKQPNRGLM